MCGIGGIVRFDGQPIAQERLAAMLAQLHHRGPDGQGWLIDGRCGLAHTRLAIIDPARGAQPMSLQARGEQGGLTVVFNGEIYNHRDLRRRLEALGHQFTTDHCDTEVLLHGYRAWGEELPRRLEGMFAFAIWNSRDQRLYLARDRTGKKPLYVRSDGLELIFGSEVGTVLAGMPAGQITKVCHEAIRQFLQFGYTFGQSLIEGVEEIPPAHWVSVTLDGQPKKERYWHLPQPQPGEHTRDLAETVRKTIAAAVQARLEADVPLGCFLSGGIDSSVVAALAQQAMLDQGLPPLRTFSVAMPSTDYDESPHARMVAHHLKTQHTELMAQPSADLSADLMQVIAASGEPTGDSSILPTYWLSQATREHVKVVLSGDGGDELFAGYDRYRAMRWLAKYDKLIRPIPLGWMSSKDPRSRSARLRRLVYAARRARRDDQYVHIIELFSESQREALGAAAHENSDIPPMLIRPMYLDGWSHGADPVEAAMRWDFHHYLPFDLLRKVDRASMAVALEVRCPLLDSSVCALAASLPAAALTPGGKPKGLLRQVATPLLPSEIVRRPKRGFAIPIGHWFRTSLRSALRDEILGSGLIDLGLDRDAIAKMESDHAEGHADHGQRLFALLSLAVWNRWRKRGHG